MRTVPYKIRLYSKIFPIYIYFPYMYISIYDETCWLNPTLPSQATLQAQPKCTAAPVPTRHPSPGRSPARPNTRPRSCARSNRNLPGVRKFYRSLYGSKVHCTFLESVWGMIWGLSTFSGGVWIHILAT